jgi:predicted RNA-binding protein YlxR (DUF448 family)
MTKIKKIPQRRCCGCQSFSAKKTLLRVVRTPSGEVMIDPGGKMSGRGAYVCCEETCLNALKSNRGLERALKTPIPAEIYEVLKQKVQAE